MTEAKLPALYLSHGAPMLLENELWVSQLEAWAGAIAKPKGILIVSAHCEAAPVSISATAANTPLVYDFSGFAQKFYEMTYNTPDASWLGEMVAKLMPDNETVHEHKTRGLDHGAWVPLRVMYPNADIPVVQMSMPTHDPIRLIELGRRLRPLRDEGILIIGSGFMTHGLPYLRDWSPNAAAPGWSSDFDLWAAEAINTGDIDSLINYRNEAPGLAYAHPTVEHFTPLFITLGAASAEDAPVKTAIDGYFMGLAKRSIEVA